LMITPCYVIQVVGARVDVSLFTPCLNKKSSPAFGLVDGGLSRKPPMSSGSAHAAPAAPLRPQFPRAYNRPLPSTSASIAAARRSGASPLTLLARRVRTVAR